MSLKVLKQALEVEQLVGSQSAQVLLRAEALVPGAGREAIEALMAEADLVIGNVDVQTDRVVIDGAAHCQAIYRQGDESTLRALTAQAALSHVFDLPGAQAGLPGRVHAQVENVEAKYENGHMVFYVSVSVAVQVMRLVPTEVITGLEGVDALEADYQEIRSVKLAAENSVSVALTEEVSLPAALDARMALMDWAGVQIDQTAADLGGVRVSGKVNLETLISSGVAGRPVALIKYPVAFEQLVELPEWLTKDVHADATIRRLSTQVEQGEEGEDAILRIEAELLISLQALATDSAMALTDAYTTSGPALEIGRQEISLASRIDRGQCAEAFRGTVLLPEGAPPVGNVLAVRVRPNLGGWSSENGRSVLEGVLEANVLYMPGGSDKLAAARAELPFEITCQGELTEDSWVCVEAVSADANALMSDRIELRCSLIASTETRVIEEISLVQSVQEGEPAAKRPGIVLFWPGRDDSIWSIGKRYNVPVSEVLAMNGGTSLIRQGKALVLRI